MIYWWFNDGLLVYLNQIQLYVTKFEKSKYAIVDFGKYTMGKQLSVQYAKVDFEKYTMGTG